MTLQYKDNIIFAAHELANLYRWFNFLKTQAKCIYIKGLNQVMYIPKMNYVRHQKIFKLEGLLRDKITKFIIQKFSTQTFT